MNSNQAEKNGRHKHTIPINKLSEDMEGLVRKEYLKAEK